MKMQNDESVILRNTVISRKSVKIERETFRLDDVADKLKIAIGIGNLAHTDDALDSITWTFSPYDWVSDNGVLVAKETESKVTLIRVPIIDAPGWRLYSTYLSRITTQGYRTRPYQGGRNPQSSGWMNLDMNFLNKDGGYLDGWDYKFYMQCHWTNHELANTSHNYNNDFFSIVKDASCSVSFGGIVKC